MCSKLMHMQKKSFQDKVRSVVAAIPKGSVMTYAQVAKKAGNPGAARAVGSMMRKNFDLKVPCHRVVRSDRVIGSYNRGGPNKKAKLLAGEGVKVMGGKVVMK